MNIYLRKINEKMIILIVIKGLISIRRNLKVRNELERKLLELKKKQKGKA